ncbi:MAG: hypothetical protein AB1714_02525 [Acidobacteriota bacterium]
MGRNRWAIASFLAAFLFVLASVDASHTEKDICANDDCPACIYCQSLGTAQDVDLSPPWQLDVVELLGQIGMPPPRQAAVVVPISRSPPPA